jgi:predicted cupin superfamily sugar epimerase
MKKLDALYFIKTLNLIKHPEGGYFMEVYRSEELIKSKHLPERYNYQHCFSTSIYFLLESKDISAFHRISSDETFIINETGRLQTVIIGSNPLKGECFQHTVKRGCWFAAKVINPDSFSLTGCTVAPGFDFRDFELAGRCELIKIFPQHKEIITELTRSYE